MTKPFATLRGAILEGKYDRRLDLILRSVARAIQERREVLSREALDNLVVGEPVRTLPGAYKPRYLANRTGRINRIEHTTGRVWIDLDEPIVRKTKMIKSVGMTALYVEAIGPSE